jgi:hypothetical protein
MIRARIPMESNMDLLGLVIINLAGLPAFELARLFR